MLFSSVFKITTEIKLTMDIMVWIVSLSNQDLRMEMDL